MLIDTDTFDALPFDVQKLVVAQFLDDANTVRRRSPRPAMTLGEARRQRSIEFWRDHMGELAAENVFGDDIIDLLK